MDQFGAVFKLYLDKMASENVRQASDMADEMLKEGCTYSQAKELLFANGFSEDVIKSVLETYPKVGKKK